MSPATPVEDLQRHFRPFFRQLFAGCLGIGSEAATTWVDPKGDGKGPKDTFAKIAAVVGCATTIAAIMEPVVEYRWLRPVALKDKCGIRPPPKTWPRDKRRRQLKKESVQLARRICPGIAAPDHSAEALLAGLACWAPHILLSGKVSAQ